MTPGRAIALVLALLSLAPPAAHAQPPTPTDPAPPTVVHRADTADPPQQVTPTPSPTTRPTDTPLPPSATITTTARPAATDTPTETDVPPDLPNEERPVIVVDGFDVDPDRPSPGSRFRLTLHVKNEGEHFAENIQLTLTSSTFLPVSQGAVLFANSIDDGETESLGIDMRVTSDAKAGVYPIAIALRWDDSYGGKYTDDAAIGIEVGGAGATRPILTVVGSRLPGRVAPGAPFNLALDILNTGGKEARNVTVAPASGPLAIQGGGGGPLNIAPGAGATVALRAAASGSDNPGAVSQAFEIRYDDPDGTRYTESHVVGTIVTGDAASDPLPMVASYRVQSGAGQRTASGRAGGNDGGDAGAGLQTLHPGEVFTLALDLFNAGPADALSTRLAFGGGSSPSATGSASAGGSLGVFAPVGTSNLRFLDRLAAGETRTVEQRLVIDGAAKPGVYVLEIELNYLDASGQALNSSEVVSLLVDRKVTLDLNSTGVYTRTTVGVPSPITLDLVNTGTSTVNVGNARIEGRGLTVTRGGKQYVGPLDASGFFTLDAEVLPDTPGIAQATIVVEYTDNFNQLQTFEQRIDFEVAAMPERPERPEGALPAVPPRSLPWRILRGLLGLGASQAPGADVGVGPEGFGAGEMDGAGAAPPGVDVEPAR